MLFEIAKLAAAVCLFVVITLFSLVAFAGDSAAAVTDLTAIKFQDAAVYVIGLVFAALGAGASYISGKLFGAKGKIPLNVEHKAAIDNAIQVGLREAEAKLKTLAQGAPNIRVQSEVVASVGNFVLASAPTALNALNITPAKLVAMIQDKLELQTAEHAQTAGGNDA